MWSTFVFLRPSTTSAACFTYIIRIAFIFALIPITFWYGTSTIDPSIFTGGETQKGDLMFIRIVIAIPEGLDHRPTPASKGSSNVS
jgi:hypothetical protein